MKKETHPKYEDTTIACACGELIQTRSTKKTSMLKFVLNAIRFLRETKSLLIQLDVSIDLKSVILKKANKFCL